MSSKTPERVNVSAPSHTLAGMVQRRGVRRTGQLGQATRGLAVSLAHLWSSREPLKHSRQRGDMDFIQ